MTTNLPVYNKDILLADGDENGRFFFKDALKELPLSFNLTIVNNGEELMDLLNQKKRQLPDVLFLDLNMTLKNGFECLSEIRNNKRLNQLRVIMFSTSYAPEEVEQFYKNGAQFYVRKPHDVAQYKKVIYHSLHLQHPKSFTKITDTVSGNFSLFTN